MINPQPIRTRRKQTALVNPQTKRTRTTSGAKKRRTTNPGALITLGPFVNPQKEKAPVSKKKAQKKTRRHSTTGAKKRARRNPVKVFAFSKPSKKVRRRARRNPEGLLSKKTPSDMVKGGLAAGAGFLAARHLPQMILGAKNSGVIGYVGNAVATIAAAAAAAQFLGPQLAYAVLIGGSLYSIERVVSDQTPLGKQLSLTGVGDPRAAGRLNGVVVPAYFPTPVVYGRDGRPVIPTEIDAAAAVSAALRSLPAPVAQPAGELGRVSRFKSRFAA